MNFLKSLFNLGQATDYKSMVKRGGIILDVRTPEEYRAGNIKGSVNLPLQKLETEMKKLNKSKPVITCCASGMRSANAKTVLQNAGFTEVYNGGGWVSLNEKLK